MKPLIKTVNLIKNYLIDEVYLPILKGLNLEIRAGEMVAVTGPSGCGKSTLMHLLGLLDTATSGQILFDGADTGRLNDTQRSSFRSDKIGFVFQQFNLLKKFSSLENVLLPTIYHHVVQPAGSGGKNRAVELLTEVGLSHRLNHSVSKLSGGEQQRVAIARALINDPQLILADEPTGNLDSKAGAEILGLLKNLNQKGKTIIMVTHDQTVAASCQRVIKMKDGEVVGT